MASAVAAPTDCVFGVGVGNNRMSLTVRASSRCGIALAPAVQRSGGTAHVFVCRRRRQCMRSTPSRPRSLVVRAAKLPTGVEAPVEEPKLPVSLWGFTEKAEVWNSRVAMIGLFVLIALEFFAHRGILQMIGVDVGKGLNIPL